MQVVEIMNLSELLAASLGVTGLSTSNGIIWEDGEFGDSDYDR